MRKSLAGGLIRLAHRIYPPKVTHDHSIGFHLDASVIPGHFKGWCEQQSRLDRLTDFN